MEYPGNSHKKRLWPKTIPPPTAMLLQNRNAP